MVSGDAGRPVTIDDVATQAQVSRATVSRVMNGLATVDPAIAERVRRAVELLQYRPSETARSLSLGRTNTVAVLVPDLANPMFQSILRGVTRAAAEDGFRVLVGDTQETPDAERDAAIQARRRCDALVLCAPRMGETDLEAVLAAASPVAVVNRGIEAGAVPQVSMDYEQAIGLLVEHLVGLGHRHLVYAGGPPTSASNRLRGLGLDAALARRPDLRIDRVSVGSTLEDGFASAAQVLGTGASAVLAFNDLVALGLLSRLRELDVAVPERLSVVGVDDIPFARFSTPALTTVHVPQEALGVQAWRQLHQVMRGDGAPGPLWLEGSLEVRASTGPVPA
ncbi:LacI family DNA-binding transcriptional regulator [Microbacterium pygmaeum]|uniref:Transcriptional regulator, LacI family n=1 Tax=Microbacterium pygmaeum TaxID=370764 RepID=A0A1G7VYT1_9MICO|nr:LacI family DNA-binding transcriptional regulator [Microbacterium pygmaeum]SDG64925.1 transcriptional regulator, LacI family [Microbacterium pygmaeum]